MRIEREDTRSDYGEERFQVIGLSGFNLLFVAYAERHENTIRIISARKANKNEVRKYSKGSW